jgi:hypothetical protein
MLEKGDVFPVRRNGRRPAVERSESGEKFLSRRSDRGQRSDRRDQRKPERPGKK